MRSTGGWPPSASHQRLHQTVAGSIGPGRSWDRGGGRKGRLLPPQPCLCPAHRRRSVFTPLDYKDPHFLSVNNSSFQAVTHESRCLTANQRYRRKQIKLTHSGCGIPAATCLFCCNWTRTRGPDVDSACRVIACFLSSWQDNMRKTDWMTPTELL